MTLLIFLSYYLVFTLLKRRPIHQKIIFAGILTAGQMILTELLLGVLGLLYCPLLLLVNGIVIIAVFLYLHSFLKIRIVPWKEEGVLFLRGVKSLMSLSNNLLIALAGFVLIWMAAAVYFLPPRTSDDTVYHLPSIFEYIIDHRIFLLPVTMDSHFAFPENAELLFMWPAIFAHSQQFVGAVQLVVAFGGVAVIYGLARALEIKPRTALFVALLFLFSPLVLAQMGSCYIDIITGVFFLAAFYCSFMFYKTTDIVCFYTMSLAAGLTLGMRYDSMILLVTLLPFIFKSRRSMTTKHWMGGGFIFVITGGSWYLRNLILLGTPIYPMDLSLKGLGIFKVSSMDGSMINFLEGVLQKLFYLWEDIGLGSLHGGYGMVFWGIALPAWFYMLIRSIIKKDSTGVWLSIPLLVGVAKLMPVPLEWFHLIERYSLFIVPLALLALGQVLTIFDREVFFIRIVKLSCVIFSILSVIQLSAVLYPKYQIDRPIKDFVKDKYLTEERYDYVFPKYLVKAWALLDYLTLDGPRGLSCYFAMKETSSAFPMGKTWISPLYGTRLQNRVWNLQEDKTLPPDAFLYLGPFDHLNYFGFPITLQEVRNDPNYILVPQSGSPDILLFLKKDLLKDPYIKQRLKEALEGDL